MAYLDTHRPRRAQQRCPRRDDPSGLCVVHTAENVMDTVGPDTGAENVARWIVTRPDPGSYHDLVDSDSWLPVVRYDCEAFHDATGSNPFSYGLSFALAAADWPALTPADRRAFLENGARAAERWARWVRTETGIVVPARRVTRAQSSARVPGFISHAERDPARRTDPGARFPWTAFLARFAERMGYVHPTPSPPGGDDMQAPCSLWHFRGDNRVYTVAADMQSATHVPNPDALTFTQALLRLGGHSDALNVADRGDDDGQWLAGIVRRSGYTP